MTPIMCDFCSDLNVRWRLMTVSFTREFPPEVQRIIGIRGTLSEGDWAACDTCMDSIKKRQKLRLVIRSYRNLLTIQPGIKGLPPHDRARIKEELAAIQNFFWVNWTGLAEPHPPPTPTSAKEV